MVRQPRRTRLVGTCPRCQAPLRVHEVGLTVDQVAGPVGWQMVNRECSRGCLLTVDDFSDE